MAYSILIPTYNFDCTDLVLSLLSQANRSGEPYEILIGDDGSTKGDVVKRLVAIGSQPHCRLVRSRRNIGRSAIRNLLALESNHPYLLFIDSDAQVVSDHFLEDYLCAIESHDVVSGKIVQTNTEPPAKMHLRWAYEKNAEQRFNAERFNDSDYPPFSTFCFMIRKEVFMQVKFNEELKGYGYEDSLFIKEINDHLYDHYYIDTPLLHGGLDTNEAFVQKTEEALRTLKQYERDLMKEVRLLRYVHRMKQWGLVPIAKAMGKFSLGRMRRKLCSDQASLSSFNKYKLLYYLQLKKEP